MKKSMTGIAFLVLLLSGPFVFAQMTGGMMKDQNKSISQGQMKEQGGMMEHGQMMGGMMDLSNQMSEMMGKMSGTMKDMPAVKMKSMSGVMNDMSHQMREMSMAIGNGRVSAREMKQMEDRMMEIKKEMSGMEMHK
jgi:hypothetical protein